MIGKTIFHYKIMEELSRGSTDVVYKAQDTRLERTVAINFLPRQIAAQDEERERSKIEAKADSDAEPSEHRPHPNTLKGRNCTMSAIVSEDA